MASKSDGLDQKRPQQNLEDLLKSIQHINELQDRGVLRDAPEEARQAYLQRLQAKADEIRSMLFALQQQGNHQRPQNGGDGSSFFNSPSMAATSTPNLSNAGKGRDYLNCMDGTRILVLFVHP